MQSGNIPEGVPEFTIGHHVIWWVEKNINQPDGDRAGERIRLTNEQKHFLLWMYAVDRKGRWLYRTAALRRAKGWGKSPFLAVICIVEFVGPCRFWKFHKGQALGKRIAAPWVQIAATAIHQTVNTLDAIRGALVGSPLAEELDIGKTIIQFRDGRPGKIEPVTSNSATLEGGRPTFAVLDETHHWTESNGGWKVAEVIDRNIRKNPGGLARYIETTNAYNPTQNSTAQKTHEAILNGAHKILYDCVEAPTVEDPEWDIKAPENEPQLRQMVEEAYGDASWIDIDSILEAIYDPRTSVAVAFRFYLNNIRESADNWIPKAEWEAILLEGHEIRATTDKKKQRQISIGFDGSLYHDATAIVGCEIATGALFLIGLWEKTEDDGDDWQVPVFEVDARMRWAFEHYEVVWVYADESYWQNIVGAWALDFKWGKDDKDCVFAFSPQRVRQMASAIERFETAVKIREHIGHLGDENLTRHVMQASRRETPYGDLIQKESKNSKKKIDAAICAVLAYEARADALEDGRMKVRKKGRMRSA